MKLLERDQSLATLQAELQRAVVGPGQLLLVEGAAGIGKTSLLRAFVSRRRAEIPLYWGSCDAQPMSRPLDPLHDIAARIDGELREALLANGGRLRIFSALLDLLCKHPCLIVLDDLHWADEATLDLLRYAGRRIGRTRALMVGSFCSDTVGPLHPLRSLLGDLAASGAKRLLLQPLTVHAIGELIGERDIDAERMYRVTGGNPFFVSEALAADGEAPVNAHDAVLVRISRLSDRGRMMLEAAAVAGPRVEPWLLQELSAGEDSIDECLATGVLRRDETFHFHHELARQAVLDSLTSARARALHRQLLQALQSSASLTPQLARLAHHAHGAADETAVLKFAPLVAREASVMGAHREAAQQFERALQFAPSSSSLRASLLDEYASECLSSGLLVEAIEAQQAAATLWRELHDVERQAISLARLSHALGVAGRNVDGEATMHAALELVGSQATIAALTVHRWAAHQRMLDRDLDEAIQRASAARQSAEQLCDDEAAIHCLNTLGTAMIVSGQVEAGCEHLERSLSLAEQANLDAWVANAFVHLGSACGEAYRFDLADHALRRGIEFCGERDFDFARLYQLSWQALVWMYRGRWIEASGIAHGVLAERRSPDIARITALVALGRIRARCGDAGAWEALNEAEELAGQTGSLPRVALVQAARAEAAWLEGRDSEAAIEANAGIELALRKRHAWFASELLFWCWHGDGTLPGGMPEFCADRPFALEISGHWREAAAAWRTLSCPFEAARALVEGDQTAQREALSVFESFNARPMAERVRYKLRSPVARGPHRAGRDRAQNTPAALTAKEIAVLALLARGMKSKDIGQRLHCSTRAVDHHLAAIFDKFDVTSRADAVSAAYRFGVISSS